VRQRDPSSSVVLTLSNLRKHNSDGKPTDFVFTTWEGPNRFVGYINKEHSPPVPEFSSAVRRPREIAARFDLPFLLSRAMNVTTAKDKRPKGRDQHVNNRNRESGLASPRHSESSSIPYGRSVTISRGLRSPRTLATTSELVASPHSTWCGPSSQRSPSRNCVDQPFSAARRTIWQIRGSATGWYSWAWKMALQYDGASMRSDPTVLPGAVSAATIRGSGALELSSNCNESPNQATEYRNRLHG
jgi:hypothetical protein